MSRTPTEMETRVARAIAALGDHPGFSKVWDDPKGRANALNWARTAIRAMREPGHDVTAAVVRPGDDRTQVVNTWQAMIDAASPPEGGPQK